MFRQTPGSQVQAKAHYERAIALTHDPQVGLGLSYFSNSM